MTDTSTQPTEPFDALSQGTVDTVAAAAADDTVKQVFEHPTIGTVVAAAQDPQVQAVAHLIPEIVKETKAGWKTTEFWATIAALVGVNLNGVILTLPDKYQGIISGALVVAYGISRGIAKKGIPAIEPSPVSVAPADAIVQRPEA